MRSKLAAVLAVSLLSVVPISLSAQSKKKPARAARKPKPVSAHMNVVPDLAQRLVKYRAVNMPFRSAGFSARERKLVDKLVEACRYLEDIYWRQSDPEALTLYQQLAGSRSLQDRNLRKFLWINASRFDLLDENRPFVGTEPMPPGRGFYPEGLTREQLEQYVKAHPEKKAELYSSYTLVRRRGDDLESLPYQVAYRAFLRPAAKALRQAAALTSDKAFAKFLRLRAAALLTDDYYPSDVAWLELNNPKFDLIFAPYETYEDGLLGIKGSYGAAVLIRNEAESKKLEMFQKYVAEIQEALPLAPEDRPSKRGLHTPMQVVDSPFRTGDLNHGYQAVANNLPNDPRIHQEKGTKKTFFKNFMDARVNYVILPIAKRLMSPQQAARATGEGYLASTIMHEIAHGLGPAYARTAAGKVDIREAIGPLFSPLEEAKANAVGLLGLKWLVDHDVLPKQRLEEYYASELAGIFRTVRFGVGEAHGRAEIMEFNFLVEQKAITRDASGRYVIDYERMPAAIDALAKELLEIEASGDRGRAERWFSKYQAMPADLQAALKRLHDIPVDTSPIFAFPQSVQ
jgi:hypothetical protein